MASPNRKSMLLTKDQREELSNQFDSVDTDGSGFIDLNELKEALDVCGIKLPMYRVRLMIDEHDKNKFSAKDGKLNMEEFEELYKKLKGEDVSLTFKTMVSKRENVTTIGGMSDASSEGTTHSVRQSEQVAFAEWLNSNLFSDPDLKGILPINPEKQDLYEKVKNGILLCKTINHSCPDTIDERALNKKNLNLYTMHENLTLALNSAQAIGCNVVNIDAHDLSKGKPHLVLGLLWQIIRIGLFNLITLEHCPGLVHLLQDDEEMADLMKLSPEAILLRWVNYHLERAGDPRRINNFTNDIKDSEAYTVLLKQIAPPEAGVNQEALTERDLMKRAEIMLKQAEKLDCRSFLSPEEVVTGNYKLNVAFVANLFNNHPGLDKPDEAIEYEHIEESREEKTYRSWMNSLGVNPHVNWLYNDLCDGVVLFQLYDIIKPGIVDWNKVHKKFVKIKMTMEKIENCNYAIELGKTLKFSLIGIDGSNIYQGQPTLTLALIWQLMRAYTLTILSNLAGNETPILDKEIIEWVNTTLQEANKTTSIKTFRDSSISNGRVIIDLIDVLHPNLIDYSQVNEGNSDEEKMENAKYAISMARKMGARIYALPEDIAEVKSKMVLTVFACLMGTSFIPKV
ncbi:Plastin-1 [Nymphon striatum]|nr:Plastin-1 [Nymphon striatum]